MIPTGFIFDSIKIEKSCFNLTVSTHYCTIVKEKGKLFYALGLI